jgi:hypothetical protein
MKNSLIETKTGGGSFAFIVAGYLSWALLFYVPGLQDNLPITLREQLPFLVAWLLGTVIAWWLPHTHRQDLLPLVEASATVIQEVAPPPPPVTAPAYQDVPLPEVAPTPTGDTGPSPTGAVAEPSGGAPRKA